MSDWSPSQWISSLSVVLGLGCPVAVFVFLSCVSSVDDLAEKLDSTPARVLEAVVSHLRTGGCGGLRFGVADTSLGVVVQALSRHSVCCVQVVERAECSRSDFAGAAVIHLFE